MIRRRTPLLALAIAVVSMAIYWPATEFEFVNYDDHRYVYENQRVLDGLNADNIRWAFSTFEFSNWHPMTWLSLMLDASIFGPEPRGFHLTSIVLHAINASLIMILLVRMTRSPWRSALVAALFALHPLHVESVAWVSSRKDVLSLMFGLLAMLAYVQRVRNQPRRGDMTNSASVIARNRMWYVLTMLAFALSLLSKPTLVTLPFVFLLLDWWPLDRLRTPKDWIPLALEKTPLFLLSVASCFVTIAAQQAGGAIRDFTQVPVAERIANSVIAYATYLMQTVWPSDLAVFYPRPTTIGTGELLASIITLSLVTLACILMANRGRREPVVGWLWFMGGLAPMIGIIQVGAAAHADRYTYFPLIGVFIALAWMLPGTTQVAVKWSAVAATTALIALTAICWFQIGYWRDSVTLASRALSVTENNYVAHALLGDALVQANRLDVGIAHLEEATRIEPTYPQAWHNLGYAYAQATMNPQAIAAYQRAIELRPTMAENHFNLGLLFQAANRHAEAQAAFARAMELAQQAGDEHLAQLAADAMTR